MKSITEQTGSTIDINGIARECRRNEAEGAQRIASLYSKEVIELALEELGDEYSHCGGGFEEVCVNAKGRAARAIIRQALTLASGK